MARKRKKIAAQDDSAVPRRWGSSQVDGGKIAGESWEFMGVYTIYHQTNMFLKSKQTPLFFNQPMGIWDIYGYKIIYEISRLNGGS